MKEIISALIKAKNEFLPVLRNETADILTKSGGKFSYNYAPLEVCIEATTKPLSNNGLTVIQTFGIKEGKSTLITTLYHVSGESISGEQILECADNLDPQKVGSASTYSRRYGYMAILGIAPEDDDANHESRKPENKQETVKPNTKLAEAKKVDGEIIAEFCEKKIRSGVKDKKTWTVVDYIVSEDKGETFTTISSFKDVACNSGDSLKFSNIKETAFNGEKKLSASLVEIINIEKSPEISF